MQNAYEVNNLMRIKIICVGNSNILAIGHESKLNEALCIAGLIFNITVVMMKGPNK